MACSTVPYCLGVWRDARCTPCAVTTPSATRKPAQHCLQHPRPFLYRAWRWAASPRVALPPRPWDGQRHQAAWSCLRAPSAACLQFLPSSSLRQLRTATSKTSVAPMDRGGHQGPGCAGTAPMACATALRCLGVWMDTQCTLGAVESLVAARWPSQCCWQHPSLLLIRPWLARGRQT